ncbi:MAG: hypothetical protein ACYC96_07755 [Fimbriimonadaceae bacterium]
MKVIRNTVFTLSLVLLSAGYAASQVAYDAGAFQRYAARVDCTPVRAVALILLACCVIFPLLDSPREAAKR